MKNQSVLSIRCGSKQDSPPATISAATFRFQVIRASRKRVDGQGKGGSLGQHDLGYRSLFSHPRLVEELVRGFVDEPWVEKLDFETLKRVNVSYVSPKLKRREGDLLWKLLLRDGSPVYRRGS